MVLVGGERQKKSSTGREVSTFYLSFPFASTSTTKKRKRKKEPPRPKVTDDRLGMITPTGW